MVDPAVLFGTIVAQDARSQEVLPRTST